MASESDRNEAIGTSGNRSTIDGSNGKSTSNTNIAAAATGGGSGTSTSIGSLATEYLTHFLVILFGISSWVSVNGIWVELPLFVQKLPEGWNLPSYMAVVVELANVGPIVYGILKRFFPRKVHETSATFVMMTVGTLACFMLIFLWSQTTSIGGAMHSLYLLVLLFFVSLVDCTSSMVFLPFMSFFKNKYLVSLFVGEGLSGLLPGLVTILQGINASPKCVNVTQNVTIEVKSEPNFGIEPFFGFITAMMLISFVAFVLLRYLPSLESERLVDRTFNYSIRHRLEPADVSYSAKGVSDYGTSGSTSRLDGVADDSTTTTLRMIPTFLLALQMWICVLSNGIMPQVSSYYCLPYGNTAYHYATSLSSVASPLACFLAIFVHVRNAAALTSLTALGTLFAAYLMILALLSPVPPLVGTSAGGIIVVVVQICYSGTFSFAKVCLAASFRKHGGIRALFWCGAATQTGSAIGSFIMFVVVNYLKVFHSVKHRPCA